MNALCSPLMSAVWLLIRNPNSSSVALMVELSLSIRASCLAPLNNLLNTAAYPKMT